MEEDIKDFSEPVLLEPKKFKLNGHTFTCAAVLPAGGTQIIAKIHQSSEMQSILLLGEFLSVVMFPESAELFTKVICDPENPVTDTQLGNLMKWLVAEYTSGQGGEGRPTTQPSTSVPGPNGTGTTLTAGVQLTE